MAFCYRIFNHLIQSNLECPHLNQTLTTQLPDVIAEVVQQPLAPQHAKSDLLRVFEVGEFLVRDGRHIQAHFVPDFDPKLQAAYLIGLGMIMVLYQRGYLVIHSNAIALDSNTGVVFMAPSGTGKSTLSAAFHQHGYQILTDDVSAIYFEDNQPYILPAYPYIKLWRDSVEAYDHDLDQLQVMPFKAGKYYVPLNDSQCQNPVPLRAVYLLDTEQPSQALTGMTAFTQLNLNLSWPELVGHFSLNQTIFELCSKLYQSVPMFRILRPELNCLQDPTQFKNWLTTLPHATLNQETKDVLVQT